MNFKRGDAVEVEIGDLAFGGAGVGRLKMPDSSDFVVFVEGTIPGDFVEVAFTKITKNFGEARFLRIIKPSPLRIAPRCRHFGVCGGCSFQCLDYGEQLKWKEKIVRDSLLRIGKISSPPILPIIGSPSPWFYRNKMEYSFGSDENGLKLGLHPAKSYKDVFDLSECFLESELSAQIAIAVKAWAVSKKIPAYDPRVNSGVLRNLTVREGKNTGEVMVNLVTNGTEFQHEKDFAKLVGEKFLAVTSVYRTAITIQRGHKTVVEEFHLAGKKTLTETLAVKNSNGKNATLKFEILPQSFFQPNTVGAQVLYETALNFIGPQGTETVYDLFCGTGTIGMFAASGAKEVFGIELNPSAVENARKNATQNKVKNIEFICGDVDKVLPTLKKENDAPQGRGINDLASLRLGLADIIITDPPRSGIFPKTLQKILELRPAKWVYVSCNPTTLARDLKEAVATGYKLQKVQPVDMFPHTYHVETVCLLT